MITHYSGRFIWVIFSLVFLCESAIAQREQIGIRIEHFGETSFSNPVPIPLSSSARVGATQVQINANLRTILGEEGESVLYNGFQYRFLSARINDVLLYDPNLSLPNVRLRPTIYSDQQFHLFIYDFLALHTLSEDYTLVISARPGIFSDFKDITTDHFRLEGAAFIDKQISSTLTLGLGVARSSNFGRVLILPVLHAIYFGGTQFMIDALLPARADLWFYPTKEIELGINFSLNGAQYRIGEKSELPADQFGFANGVIASVLRYNLFSKVYISSELGYTVLRRMELVNSNLSGDERFVEQFNPQKTWLFKLGVHLMY